MKHGGVMMSDILSEKTIHELRIFIQRKNVQVKGTPAEFPMTQKKYRTSFGIEPNDDPSVVRALKEIHHHPIFGPTIQTMLGDDNPALSEITAITVKAGAGSQNWHSDVNSDGNGLMYGRTYSHSYSLFIPLQNTTAKQGPTDLCPGTHYCADDGLTALCHEHRIGLHEIRPTSSSAAVEEEKIWKRGDGFIINQQGKLLLGWT
jgi:hypothetical protein